ncbi:putative transposable element [Trichonephila clavipes]|nr:putative transposable element [Trichonephila clavipes]
MALGGSLPQINLGVQDSFFLPQLADHGPKVPRDKLQSFSSSTISSFLNSPCMYTVILVVTKFFVRNSLVDFQKGQIVGACLAKDIVTKASQLLGISKGSVSINHDSIHAVPQERLLRLGLGLPKSSISGCPVLGLTFQFLTLSCQVIYSQFGLAIHQNDPQARRRFIEWAQNEIAVVPDFHKRILFSDEAHFWLNGYVNKQNCRIWSEANPQAYVETPLHPEKLTVWCALWAGAILLQKL